MKLVRILKLLFLGVALLFSISIGYGRLTQDLSIDSTATVVPPASPYNITPTLNKSGNTYHYTIVLTYNGLDPGVTSWELTIMIPTDSIPITQRTGIQDFSDCNYQFNPNTGALKISNGTSNGTIARLGGTVTFHIGFTTATGYTLTSANITAANFYSTLNPAPNLTAYTFALGAVTFTSNADNSVPHDYTLTLNNNSGHNLQKWVLDLKIDKNISTNQIYSVMVSPRAYCVYTAANSVDHLCLYGGSMAAGSSLPTESYKVNYTGSGLPKLTAFSFKGYY